MIRKNKLILCLILFLVGCSSVPNDTDQKKMISDYLKKCRFIVCVKDQKNEFCKPCWIYDGIDKINIESVTFRENRFDSKGGNGFITSEIVAKTKAKGVPTSGILSPGDNNCKDNAYNSDIKFRLVLRVDVKKYDSGWIITDQPWAFGGLSNEIVVLE